MKNALNKLVSILMYFSILQMSSRLLANDFSIDQLIEAGNGLLLPTETRFTTEETIKAEMGYALFRDTRLSLNAKVSCATCHIPEKFFSDTTDVSQGIGHTSRNTPTIVNSRFGNSFFWDGRVLTLAEQAKIPLEHQAEHGISRTYVSQIIYKNYKPLYEKAYGSFPTSISEILKSDTPFHAYPQLPNLKLNDSKIKFQQDHQNKQWIANWIKLSQQQKKDFNEIFQNIADSISQFQKGLITKKSDFDFFIEKLATSKKIEASFTEKFNNLSLSGFKIFIGRGQCISCHNTSNFSDNLFHNTGIQSDDIGRSQALINNHNIYCSYYPLSKCPNDFDNSLLTQEAGKFKTPSLRNISKTAPYMHNGRLRTLDEVLLHYTKISQMQNSQLDPSLKNIILTKEDFSAVKSFLLSLDSDIVDLSEY